MDTFPILASITLLLLTVLLAVPALSRLKKNRIRELVLLRAEARVFSELNPEGSVLLRGELWRARSRNGQNIAKDIPVRIVQVNRHLLIVELS